MFLINLKSPEDPPIAIREQLKIGQSFRNDLVVREDEICERHAIIEKKKLGYVIRQLDPEALLYINGTQVFHAHLKNGDKLKLGRRTWLVTKNSKGRKGVLLKSRNPFWNQQLSSLTNMAMTSHPILILGESGTGKEILVQNLHEFSKNVNGPLISLNCSALSESLIESELFGHRRGSFTGAMSDRKGAFEAARGGTLFLDEIGDLPLNLQPKLLRALENKEIRPIGSDRSVKTKVRIIAATHQDLKEKVELGQFRSDLYYRLNIIQLCPPSLRDRMEDFEDFLYLFAKQNHVRFSVEAIEHLKRYSWPGNIRELKNFVVRISALYPKEYIKKKHILSLFSTIHDSEKLTSLKKKGTRSSKIKEIERSLIINKLKKNFGNQSRTAVDLGIPKSTLHDRIKNYEIDAKQFKIERQVESIMA